MAVVNFPINSFTDAEGDALSYGFLLLMLNTDSLTASGQQLCSQITVQIALDVNGDVSGTPLLWPNDELSPAGSYYVLWAYTAAGQLVFGPIKLTVAAGSAFGFGSAFGLYFGS